MPHLSPADSCQLIPDPPGRPAPSPRVVCQHSLAAAQQGRVLNHQGSRLAGAAVRQQRQHLQAPLQLHHNGRRTTGWLEQTDVQQPGEVVFGSRAGTFVPPRQLRRRG